LNNPEAARVLKRVFELDDRDRIGLEQKFKAYDKTGEGYIKK